MIIDHLSEQYVGDKIKISADIKFDGETKWHTIYYIFSKNNKSSIYVDGSPFLAAVLLPCMKKGENIFINSLVSEKFLRNTRQIMKLFTSWESGFHKIKINALKQEHSKSTGTKTACFFSLGVDSFYTYLVHKGDKTPISNLLLVHGFDIDILNTKTYDQVSRKAKKLADQEKINVIKVKTNIRHITDNYIDWGWQHGAAMSSIAMLLGNKLSKVYFAGSDSWIQRKKTMPYGTHPKLDHLWSTERLQIIHDGNESTRLQKIVNVISKSTLALNFLRVCNQNLKTVYNCSKCEKCLRTMIDLQIAGVLDQAITFSNKIPLNILARTHNEEFESFVHNEDSLAELKRQNLYPELQRAIESSINLSKNPKAITKIIKFLSTLDSKYNNRRIFKYIFGIRNNEDRKMIFKLFSWLGFIR